MIELKNISKYYNNNGVVTLGLRNINLNFDKNEIVAIVGESGSGKSTLLNVICGVDSYEEGEILFNGYETSYFNREDMDTFRKQNVSFIYQNYNIIDSYTVLENVMFPLLINGYNRKEAKERALELIKKVGLEHRIKNRGTKLSGGEKQRCVIARALATDCPILACDEPTGNLDSKTGKEIIELIKEVAKDKLVLIVTHNYEQVENIVTRTIRMADGEVVSDSNVNNKVTTELKDGDVFAEDNKKIKYKTIAQIGLNNLKSTPKKNIFVFLVLLVLSIIGLVLFGEAYIASVNSNYNAHSGFANTIRERVIVYDKEHKAFDANIFDGYEKYVNAFYEDNASYSIEGTSHNYYFSESIYPTKHIPYNLSNVKGSKTIGKNQYFIVLNSNYYDNYVLEKVIEDDCYLGKEKIDIVGIGISNELSGFSLLVVCDEFYEKNSMYKNFTGSEINVDSETSNYYVKNDNTISKPLIKTRSAEGSIKGDIKIISNNSGENMYEFSLSLDECDVEYNSTSNEITVNESIFSKNCYELTIYTKDINKLEKLASNNNLSCIIPAKSGVNILSFSFMIFVFTVLCTSVVMVFLVFISYVVLQKVYQSRRKDYAIMRSLGMMRPQMAKIIRFEVLFIGTIASVISIIALYILAVNTDVDYAILKYLFSFWGIVIYLILMFLFDLRLANKFNKKLFKFTVTKTMKEVF